MNEIVCFELMNGQKLFTELEERGKLYYTIKNPVVVFTSPDGKQLSFAPCLYTDPKKMTAKLFVTSIALESYIDEELQQAYATYIGQLTSSILRLDKSIKKVELITG